jgi:hypothetical protein
MNIVMNLHSCVTELQAIRLTNSRTLCEGLYCAWDNENHRIPNSVRKQPYLGDDVC